MATVKSDWITNVEANPPVQPGPGQVRGKVRCSFASITFASAQIGDIARMLKIPKGAKILPGSYLLTAALGSGVTVAVGVSGTATKYLAATTCNTANLRTHIGDTIANLLTGLSADEELILTVGGAAATGAAALCVLWTLE